RRREPGGDGDRLRREQHAPALRRRLRHRRGHRSVRRPRRARHAGVLHQRLPSRPGGRSRTGGLRGARRPCAPPPCPGRGPGGPTPPGAPLARPQPQPWVERPRDAVAFYQAAFGAVVLPLVGDGDEIVAQLAVGGAAFWVAGAAADMGRLSPLGAHGATGRTLLVTDDPDEVVRRAVAAG